MSTLKFEIGQRVVRSKGDYVVGRTGVITAIDADKLRANVAWDNDPKSWVKFESLELESIPYVIMGSRLISKHKWSNPKYERL